jgi:hypothetical protein
LRRLATCYTTFATMKNAPLLLIVEHSPTLARALMRRANALGWKALCAMSTDEARALVGRMAFDAWIVDRELDGGRGISFVRDQPEVETKSGRRPRPRTAVWTTSPADAAEETSALDVAVFGKLDVDSMLVWLTAGRSPTTRGRAAS